MRTIQEITIYKITGHKADCISFKNYTLKVLFMTKMLINITGHQIVIYILLYIEKLCFKRIIHQSTIYK